jgi:hypothetical protein
LTFLPSRIRAEHHQFRPIAISHLHDAVTQTNAWVGDGTGKPFVRLWTSMSRLLSCRQEESRMAVNTSRPAALQLTTDLAQAGAVFNDATRLLDGGLWSTPTDNNGQMNYLSSFLADIHAVLNDVTAEVAEGVGGEISVGGTTDTLTSEDISVLQNVESELNTMITEASLSVGTGASAAAAQAALKAADAAILSDINGDSALHSALANASYAATTGSTDVGFQSLVAGIGQLSRDLGCHGPRRDPGGDRHCLQRGRKCRRRRPQFL